MRILVLVVIVAFLGCGVAADSYTAKNEECDGHESAVHKWMRWYWETYTCNDEE
jgi:hypothetical protein